MPTEVEEIRALVDGGGKYRILACNTEGANAYAFKARHIHLERDVFLKVCGRPEEERMIFEEPRLLVEATSEPHKNRHLVEVFDAEKINDDWVLFCMEWVSGGSLFKLIRENPPTVCTAVEIAKGILIGLSAFHRMLMVHCDLKPANILVCTERGNYIPKLGDFGSAVRLEEENELITGINNTILYRPTENFGDDGGHSIQSDIYQVGIVLAELLCGGLPTGEIPYLDREARREIRALGAKTLDDLDSFDRSQLVDLAIARKVQRDKLIDLLNWDVHIPRNVKSIVRKAMSSDLEIRYSRSADMLTDLNEISCPDWFKCQAEECFQALGWQGFDWKVVPRRKGGFEIKRSRAQNNSWRRWSGTYDREREAIIAVGNFG